MVRNKLIDILKTNNKERKMRKIILSLGVVLMFMLSICLIFSSVCILTLQCIFEAILKGLGDIDEYFAGIIDRW